MSRRAIVVLLSLVAQAWTVQDVSAKSPLLSLLPFKRVDADHNKDYTLSENNGPWLILAATFGGAEGEGQARELVLELRRRYKLPAYLHRRTASERFDQEEIRGLTYDKYGAPKRMKYKRNAQHDAIAVLVGDFNSIDDAKLEDSLERIKHMRPDCLDLKKRGRTMQHFAGLRDAYRRVSGDKRRRERGPMGRAFVAPNPLLPKEYFAPGGLDDFVRDLNRSVKFSLLNNPGQYTVRVATFRGDQTINQTKVQELERSGRFSDKLEFAADKAHRLTVALRKRDVEAYEFHDRNESIVAIGSFDSEGTTLANGTIDINPEIYHIMKTYGARPRQLPGQGVLGLQPTQVDGIPFDVQPLPMKVPRRSIAQDYARRQR